MKSILAFLAFAPVATLSAATIYDFESEVSFSPIGSSPLSSAWTLSGAAAAPSTSGAPFAQPAWVQPLSGGGKAGAIGATYYYDEDSDGYSVSSALADPVLSGTRVSLDIRLLASDPDIAAGQDGYSVSFFSTSSSSVAIFTANFTPAGSDTWSISLVGGATTVPVTLAAGTDYSLFIDFTGTGYSFGISTGATLLASDILGTTGTYSPTDDLTKISIGTNEVTPGWSSSALLFDNIGVGNTVPEPSTALLGAIGALGLLRRRRSH